LLKLDIFIEFLVFFILALLMKFFRT